jgi:1,4-dihydroxy-2-naphthoate polyprenyltransferase
MATSGTLLLWIGMFGVLVVIAYTAGPIPLAYLGLGEVAVFIAMGPLMVLGTYYAVSGGLASWRVALAGLPVAFTVAAILHANNMRDLEADRLANKKTLAVRFGASGARIEYMVLIYGAYAAAAVLIVLGILPWTTVIAVSTLPQAIDLVKTATSTTEPKILHRVQGQTAQLHLRFGLIMALGWLMFILVRGR